MQYDPIESAVRSTIEQVVGEWSAGEHRDWTGEVLTRLCQLSKRPEWACGACARGNPNGADYGEWLYDVCWFVEDSECLTHLPLVAECEWGPEGPCDGDFQKLLQARADHRLWLFQVPTDDAAREMFVGCRANVRRFSGSQVGDRYLFAALVWGERPALRFDLYVHGASS